MRYKTVLIDPPYPQGKTGKRKARPRQGKELDYPIMSIEDITRTVALILNRESDERCLLFLWSTDKFLEDAHGMLRSWGFKKHCVFVWNKNTGVCPFSVQFRNEFMLMGYKGKFRLKKIGLPTNFGGKSKRHSQKPEESYQLIEAIAYPPRLELFARHKRLGWDVWGNEINSDIALRPPGGTGKEEEKNADGAGQRD